MLEDQLGKKERNLRIRGSRENDSLKRWVFRIKEDGLGEVRIRKGGSGLKALKVPSGRCLLPSSMKDGKPKKKYLEKRTF